jgi:hypothetical protein
VLHVTAGNSRPCLSVSDKVGAVPTKRSTHLVMQVS